jgi:hypothetical protein
MVEQYELSTLRLKLEMLTERVEELQRAWLDELKARVERERRKTDWLLWLVPTILLIFAAAAWSSVITAAVLGD